jgi:hypothetical protein
MLHPRRSGHRRGSALHLKESFDDMTRDLAKFLVRLSRGEAPRKE